MEALMLMFSSNFFLGSILAILDKEHLEYTQHGTNPNFLCGKQQLHKKLLSCGIKTKKNAEDL